MIKSDLATQVVDFGTFNSNPRDEKIIGITPHHMAGKMLADDCARSHLYGDRGVSANYYIGYDGTICAGVSEDRRAWTSNSRTNDYSHITIEVSNDGGEPDWHIPNKAYKSLVNLCADICKRYGLTPHFTGDVNGSITYHQMFCATSCPGPYLKNLIDTTQFEEDIKAAMGNNPKPQPTKTLYRVQCGAFKVLNNAKGLADSLEEDGFDTYIVKVGELYKVQTGAFSSKKNAENLVATLEKAGYEAIITTDTGIAVKYGTDKTDPTEKYGYVIGSEYKVVVKKLNVRNGCGMDNSIIDVVTEGTIIIPVDVEKHDTETWIQRESGGWVCAIGAGTYISN